jgi:hypothetical protein
MGNNRPEGMLISRERLRRIPSTGFGWIDRRFVREGFLLRLSNEAALLYFFLVTVANPDGLSYFGEATMSGLLRMDGGTFKAVRAELEAAGLILFRHPLYQVLALPQRPATP